MHQENPIIKPFITEHNELIEIHNDLLDEIKDFTDKSINDGKAFKRYEEKNHKMKNLIKNCYEGKVAEWAIYKFLKEVKGRNIIETPDMKIWTEAERVVKGKNDPDLVEENIRYHCKSTSYKGKRGDSWSFRLTDMVMRDPQPDEVIILATVDYNMDVLVKYEMKAVDVKNFYQEPELNKYFASKKCLYEDTFQKNNLIIKK